MKKVLSIAGFDPSGKAGLLKDVKIIEMLNCYGYGVPTALTVQDFSHGYSYKPVTLKGFGEMLNHLIDNNPPDAIKIGMTPSIGIAAIIRDSLNYLDIPIVYDPVHATSDGISLIQEGVEKEIVKLISGFATVVTPNLPEYNLLNASILHIECYNHFLPDRRVILLKGGHGDGDIITDVLKIGNSKEIIHTRKRVSGIHRGTGCTLSSAFAAFLAMDADIIAAFFMAEDFMDSLMDDNQNSMWNPDVS